METTLNGRTHLSRGIMRLFRKSPFYSTIIFKHEIVENEYMDAVMGTDGKHLYFNPHICLELTPNDLLEVLKHEAMHVANRHHVRMEQCRKAYAGKCKELNLDYHKLCNVAADLAINSLLMETSEQVWTNSKFLQHGCIPECGMFADYPKDKPFEFYLKMLLEKIEQIPKELRDQMAASGKGEGTEGPGQPVTSIGPSTSTGDVQACQGDPQLADQECNETLARAAMASKGVGSECGSAKAMIETYEAPPDVNWRMELQNFFTRIVRGRPHYRNPSRRHMGGRIIFPSNKQRETSEIAMLVDMSGSMTNEAVAAVYTHISEIVKVNKTTKVRLVPFDGKVFREHIKTFDASNVPIKEEDRTRCGFGGTKFMPPIKYAEEEMQPSGIILLTDMMPADQAEFEAHRSPFPFICLSVFDACFGKGAYGHAEPHWCKVLHIKP